MLLGSRDPTAASAFRRESPPLIASPLSGPQVNWSRPPQGSSSSLRLQPRTSGILLGRRLGQYCRPSGLALGGLL